MFDMGHSFHTGVRVALLLMVMMALSIRTVDSLRLPNVCYSPTLGLCGPTHCRVGNLYSCGEKGECTCYDMNTGCGSNTSLPGALKGKRFCGYRTDASGTECGWCAVTGECSTHDACPASPPAPPPSPPSPSPPTPTTWRCAATRPECNTCGACCKSYLNNNTKACDGCVHSECPAPAPIWPCALSPYKNITPTPGVLSGPCTCTLAKQGLPDNLLVYTYSATNYVDGASCHMRLPVNGTLLAQPVFATEFQHDFLQLNGRNYSGIQREVGGIPPDAPGYPLNVTDTNMYWRPDDRIVGTGWVLVFSIPQPLPAPDPGSAPRVYSGECMFGYNANRGTGYLSNRAYMAGILVGHCIIIVPQGWYVSQIDLHTRSPNNTLSIGEHVYSGSDGPSVGLQLSGLVRWDAYQSVDHYDCADVKPFRCGFFISISKQKPQ